ncbi:MAG TPA: GGDEF domain-containing protein [Burkholderiaceae bacterium]|jgi:diguanylate cyclase (GGDEF)-like protein
MEDSIFLIEEATVGRVEFRLALSVGVLLLVLGLAATPFAGVMLPVLPGYMTSFASSMIVINILLAALLFAKGSIEHRDNAIRLAVAYLYIGLIFIPLLMAFPGGLNGKPLIGTMASPVWLWTFWHTGFGIAIMRYAWAQGKIDMRPASLGRSVLVVAALVIFLGVLATSWIDFLPPVFANGQTFFSGNGLLIPSVALSTNLVALFAVLRLRWRTPEQLWLSVGMVAACLDIWLTAYGGERYSLGWYAAKFGSLFTSLFVLFSQFHGLTVLYRKVADANRVLRNIANKDGLTGLSNRRNFDQLLDLEWQRAQRARQPLALLMLDVDQFKKYNDMYGHQAGDECLRLIARELHRATQRPGDVAARYGGEEFAIILPDTDEAGAHEVARRVIAAIQALNLAHLQNPPSLVVTASIGVSCVVPHAKASPAALISSADFALYRAKDEGRNQVCIASFIHSDAIAAPGGLVGVEAA